MRKSVLALASVALLAASALSAKAADVNVIALSVDPVVGVLATLNTSIGGVAEDLAIENQIVGANVKVDSTQPIGTVNVAAGKAGLTLGVQVTANTAVGSVGGNVNIGQTVVGTNVDVGANN